MSAQMHRSGAVSNEHCERSSTRTKTHTTKNNAHKSGGTMKVRKWTWALAGAGLVNLPAFVIAEEQPSPILTALSSTTISGYVDVSAHWNPGSDNANNPPPYLYNNNKSDGFNLNKVKLRIERPLDEAQ